MSTETDTDSTDIYDTVGFVQNSTYRLTVIDQLDARPSTPSDIAEQTAVDIAHISRALQDLREHGVAELLVPEDRKRGRIYGLTDHGEAVHARLAEMDKVTNGSDA